MSLPRLLSDPLRLPLEQRVATHLGRPWQVAHAEDMADAASHPAAVLSDGTYAVFVKLAEGSGAWDRTTREIEGLVTLTARAGVLTPPAIGAVAVGGVSGAGGLGGDVVLLILEAVDPIKRRRQQWREMGQTLARIHSVKGELYGFESHNYWGSLRQDNTPHAHWVDFYRACRLALRLQAAVDGGHLPPDVAGRVERLSERLPDLAGPPVAPSLLHGDAHHNNFITTAQGPYLIDPAVYYGHPEMDLAYIDFFAPVPEAFFAGYREIAPIDADFAERRDLWRIPAWLALVEVGGPEYLDDLLAALRRYV
ncbi:MAG: fructosamine kinase family protein [Caldilineaceae bacterium]